MEATDARGREVLGGGNRHMGKGCASWRQQMQGECLLRATDIRGGVPRGGNRREGEECHVEATGAQERGVPCGGNRPKGGCALWRQQAQGGCAL